MYEYIHGIIPPMTTPFRPDGSIDEDAMRVEVRYLLEEAKVHGLAVCGSTGEGHTLSTEETRRITTLVAGEAKGRVPIITGVIVDSTAQAIERGKAVKDLGVTALQVTVPHYVFPPDDDTALRHFEGVAKGTGLPIIIYNVVRQAILSARLLTRIITTVDGVIGVKASGGARHERRGRAHVSLLRLGSAWRHLLHLHRRPGTARSALGDGPGRGFQESPGPP